ncbi:MAG: hypothetical protein Q9160_009070 [Pyrenula sp. 1 TL-2023]
MADAQYSVGLTQQRALIALFRATRVLTKVIFSIIEQGAWHGLASHGFDQFHWHRGEAIRVRTLYDLNRMSPRVRYAYLAAERCNTATEEMLCVVWKFLEGFNVSIEMQSVNINQEAVSLRILTQPRFLRSLRDSIAGRMNWRDRAAALRWNTEAQHEILQIKIEDLDEIWTYDPTCWQYGFNDVLSEAGQYQARYVEETLEIRHANRPEPNEELWYAKPIEDSIDVWLTDPGNNVVSLHSLFLESDNTRYATLEASLLQEIDRYLIQEAQERWQRNPESE